MVLALAVLGVRCAVTRLAFSAGGCVYGDLCRPGPGVLWERTPYGAVVYGRRCWIRLGIVLAAVTVGLCVELLLSPRLLTLALERAVI